MFPLHLVLIKSRERETTSTRKAFDPFFSCSSKELSGWIIDFSFVSFSKQIIYKTISMSRLLTIRNFLESPYPIFQLKLHKYCWKPESRSFFIAKSTWFDLQKYQVKMVSDQKDNEENEYDIHLGLLKDDPTIRDRDNQQYIAPIFAAPLRNQIEQYGLIAGHSGILANSQNQKDPRLFYNIAAPFSTFICGSQGSGKSHTLSCLLENCLANSSVSKVKSPLSALLFHYDGFIGDV